MVTVLKQPLKFIYIYTYKFCRVFSSNNALYTDIRITSITSEMLPPTSYPPCFLVVSTTPELQRKETIGRILPRFLNKSSRLGETGEIGWNLGGFPKNGGYYPTNPWVFLLKMINPWGGDWGEIPPFQETPISIQPKTPSETTKDSS